MKYPGWKCIWTSYIVQANSYPSYKSQNMFDIYINGKKTSGAKFTPTFEQPSTYSVIKGWTKDPSSVHKHDMYQVISPYGRTPQLLLISFCSEK